MPEATPVRRRRPLRALALVLLTVLVLLPAVLLALTWQRQPLVAGDTAIDPADVARAVALLRTHDPRRARPGVVSGIALSERDIDVLLGHGARRWWPLAAQTRIRRAEAALRVSTPWPLLWLGGWLNVQLEWRETGGLPLLHAVRVGHLPVPPGLAQALAEQVVQRAGLGAELGLAQDVLRVVRFVPGNLLVSYAWQPGSADRLLSGLVTPEELQRLRAYSDRLVQLAAADGQRWQRPLAELMGPLFALAAQRSAQGDAAAENRAALTVLTLYATNRAIGQVLPPARAWPRPRPLQLLLRGRPDFPLHFLVSAALAAEGTLPLSRAIGVYKELADARQGSGFSFNDMAANLSGTRFGERLVREPQALQQRLAAGVTDADLVPAVEDLPEFMPEAEFRARFGGVGAPAYTAMMAEIERRVGALALLR